ncbi:MAG: hypothetical protein JXX29_04290 [Deltaproteobacteria bacterium]|nr:hypothetical protein [Deltaproteobacteria bacterium]MBN2670863.1 hypothetical protein [Deltaproteobacteria bacterium]
MFISRFWTLLLVIAAAISVSVLMLAKDLVNREREESATAGLYKELDKLEVAFTLHARKRLDVLVSVSADADVTSNMASIAHTPGKVDEYRPKLLTALNKKNDDLDKYRADMLLAVGTDGDVLVKTGAKGRENGFSLAGVPTVEAALRGYVRDDVWKLGSDVYLIAARPVIHSGQYVGAIVHGLLLTDEMASKFSNTAQVAYYSGGVMLAIGTPDSEDVARAKDSEISSPLARLESDKQYEQKNRSDIHRIKGEKQDFLAVFSKIRGQAALNGVGWAVVVPVSRPIELTSIYEEAGSQDVENLPWLTIIGGALLMILLGWFWNYFESERPISKLQKAILALEKADVKDQLNVYKYKRNVRKIAIAFNKVMDYKLKEVMNAMGEGGKNVSSILGDRDTSRLSSAAFRFAEDMADDIPAPPSALEAPPPDAKPKLPNMGGGKVMPTPPTGAAKPLTGPQKPLGAATPPGVPSIDETVYFKQVHAEFVALKQKLGEPVDQLTYERFEVTLKKNRDALKARYGCKAVKFNVYEKDGKASLKAIPVKP